MTANRSRQRRVDRPAAVILGFEANGLGVARSLHGRGIHCIGIDVCGRHAAYATRRCRIVQCAAWNEHAVVACLMETAARLERRPVLLITKDEAVLWVSGNRDRLAQYYDMVLPSRDIVDLMMNKSRFQRLAEGEGWPVPATVSIGSQEELRRQLGKMKFPCILKPSTRSREFRRNSPQKAYLVASAPELLDCYGTVSQWESSVVVQEWIPGGDDRIAFCLAYYGRNSEALALYAGRKLRQYPVDYGVTAVAAPAPDVWREPVLEASRAIFEKVGYRGLGSVEFKMREDGSPVIMEPTVGRTDWQSEIAVLNGVDIPAIAYADGAELAERIPSRSVRPCKLVNHGAHWRSFRQLHKSGRQSFAEWMAERRGRKRFMFWRWDDPGPFFSATVYTYARRLLRAQIRAVRAMIGSG